MQAIHSKVSAGVLGGWFVVVLAWLVLTITGVEIPTNVQLALAGIIGFGLGYAFPSLPKEEEKKEEVQKNGS